MKKKYSYLFIFFIIFFIHAADVNAIKFIKSSINGHSMVYFSPNLFYSTYKHDSYTSPSYVKKYSKDGGDTWNFAYCSNKKLDYSESERYVKDKRYEKYALCKYIIEEGGKDITKYRGDCSQIIGYIIKKAYDAAGSNAYKRYAYAQASVWTYLARYTYTPSGETHTNDIESISKSSKYLKRYNSGLDNVEANNSNVNSILRNAWSAYHNAVNSKKIINDSNVVNGPNMFTVSSTSLKFNYKPTSNACGSKGGNYETNKITIKNTNTNNKTIKVNISSKVKGVTICYSKKVNGEEKFSCKAEDTDVTLSIAHGDTRKIYLKATKYLRNGTATIDVDGSYTKNTHTETNRTYYTYDSERWVKTDYLQGMIIYKKNSGKYTVSTEVNTKTKYKKSVDVTAKQDKFDFGTVENIDDEATGKCGNLVTRATKDQTKVTLSGQMCKTLKFKINGKDSFVRVIITENVTFQFGNIIPSDYRAGEERTVVAGGSFQLNTKSSWGQTTYYKANVSWQFADYKKSPNGTKTPYYYNGNNPSNDNANNIVGRINELIIGTGIKEKGTATDIMNKYNYLMLNIETYNSNKITDDGKGIKTTYTIQPLISIDQDDRTPRAVNIKSKKISGKYVIGYEKADGTFVKGLTIKNIQVRKYRIKAGTLREFEYGKEPSTYRAYFTPLYYSGEEPFIFNITNSDLSVVEGIKLMYKSPCQINVENRLNSNNLSYRTISVSNPFPKTIPTNWQTWWENESNKARMAETYERDPLYHTSLTTEQIKKINEINGKSTYTSWKNMITNNKQATEEALVSGSSKVVMNSGIFDTTASSSSYCPHGQFSLDCDKQW